MAMPVCANTGTRRQFLSVIMHQSVETQACLLGSRADPSPGLWPAPEPLTAAPVQLQVNLLSKFLLIAKSCYEQRNFATAMQILGGLEHVAVRQSPVSPRGCLCGLEVGWRWSMASHTCFCSRPGEFCPQRWPRSWRS